MMHLKLYWHQLCSGLVLNLQKLLRIDLSTVIASINNYCRNLKLEASNIYIRKEYQINTQIKLCPLGINISSKSIEPFKNASDI